MTLQDSGRGLGSLSALLRDGLQSLDITAAEHDQVVARYSALGQVFDDHWSGTRGDNVISPQGSFLLGTVVRNIHRDDDIDIDMVALRDVEKTTLTQSDLKLDAGIPVRKFADTGGYGNPTVSECHRCWTLQWPGMHLDLLPAIPDRDSGRDGILITDKDVRRWLPSNPAGYATWFRRRMHDQFVTERARVALAKRLQIDDVPDRDVKTTLQQAVQALKRHRDIYFSDHLDDRPASIIITTLAARAYVGGDDAYEVLRDVTRKMEGFVERKDGHWVVANPVQGEENFADSWVQHPERAGWFFDWLERAETDFSRFGMKSGLDNTVSLFEDAFGERFAEAASLGLANTMTHARTGGSLVVGAGAMLTVDNAATTKSVKDHGFAGGSKR